MTATRSLPILALVAALAFATLALHLFGTFSLAKTELVSGPLLFILLIGLAIYGARRRSRLGTRISAATWLEAHVTVGAFTIVLFLVHLRFKLPTGVLERGLAMVYTLVTVSGLAGVWISRRALRRLAQRNDDSSAETLPSARRRLRERLAELLEAAARETGSTALAEFHERHLAAYFERTRNVIPHLLDSRRPRQRLLAELAAALRDLGEREREIGGEIAGLVRLKDDLDELDALQLAMRGWLLIHAPFTYLLLLLAAIHGVLARAYFGGLG